MTRTSTITKLTAFTLLVPIKAYDEENNVIDILVTDITDISNAQLVNTLTSQFDNTEQQALPDGVSVSATSGGIQVVSSAGLPTGYYSFFVQCMVRNLLTTINIQNALCVSEFTPKKGNNTNINLTTQPVLLSNYTTLAQDEQTQARIDLLTDQLVEKTAENNALVNTLATRNEELNTRTTQFNALNANYSDLLARYNALINGGGVTPDTDPSGDALPDMDGFDFYDWSEYQDVTPDSVTAILHFRAGLRSVETSLITKITHRSMFESCTYLTTVNLPNVTSISGGYTFQSCSQLQSISLPNVTSINSSGAFATCNNLFQIIAPNCVSLNGAGDRTLNGTRLAYIKMGAASLSFSLATWNPTYWTGQPSAENIAGLIDFATEQWEEQNTTDPYPGRANNAIDALAVLFYLGIISRIRDLRDFGEDVTSTLTLAAAFKTKLATSPLWSGYVAEANLKGWSIA